MVGRWFLSFASTLWLLSLFACTESSGPSVIAVEVSPASVTLAPGQVQEFVATVTGAVDVGVTWSASGGVLVPSGNSVSYTAPAVVGEFVLTATSVADAGREGTASISVAAADPFWARQLGSGASDFISAVAADGADHVIIAGSTFGNLFGLNQGGADAFVAKLAPDGSPVWAYQHGSGFFEQIVAVAVDGSDHVIVAGYTGAPLFGTHHGHLDAFVVKLASDGSLMWAHQYGTVARDRISAVAVDSAENVIIAGYTEGNLFGPNTGSSDAFVAKLAPDGSQVWAHQHGTSEWDAISAVGVDGSGHVLIAGSTQGSLFGPNKGNYDAFVAKLKSDGSPVWARQLGTTEVDGIDGVAADSSENVLIVGHTEGSLFGPHQGDSDMFVAKLAPDESQMWAHQYGTAAADSSNAVTVDTDDNVLFAGWTQGGLFGPNQGDADAFVAKLSPGGSQVWAQQHGSIKWDEIAAVAVDGGDHVLVAGLTAGSLFGPNNGSYDAFVARLAP